MNSKLQMLERQLNRAATKLPTSDGGDISKILAGYQADTDRTHNAAIAALESRCCTAEEEVASLLTELSEAKVQLAQERESGARKIEDVKDYRKVEMDAMRSKHCGDMEAMQSKIDALRGQVATERQDKVKAMAEKEAAEKACIRLEQTVTKLQDVKLVMPAPVAAPKPVSFETKVTRRDENGHIVSTVTTPQF